MLPCTCTSIDDAFILPHCIDIGTAALRVCSLSLHLQVSLEWAVGIGSRLEQASWGGCAALQAVMPANTAVALLDAATALLKQEPTVIDVRCSATLCLCTCSF
jgi:hypothetical protein